MVSLPSSESKVSDVEPSLLGIPREIRDTICGYFLTLNRDNRKRTGDIRGLFDYTILHINKQIRSEAIGVLVNSNIWLSSAFYHDGAKGGIANIYGLPYMPGGVLPTTEVDLLFEATVFDFKFNQHTFSDDDKSPPALITLFAYTKYSYSEFICQIVISILPHMPYLRLTINKEIVSSYRHLPQELVLPLAAIQGAKGAEVSKKMYNRLFQTLTSRMTTPHGTFQQHQEILLALKEEGNYHYKQRDNATAIVYYGLGNRIFNDFMETMSTDAIAQDARGHTLKSIYVDLCNNFSLIKNMKNVKLKSSKATFNSKDVLVLEHALALGKAAPSWCGSSQAQRQKGHARRAVAHKHLAEYYDSRENFVHSMARPDGPIGGYVPEPEALMFAAVSDAYYAHKLADPTDDVACRRAKALYDEMVRVHKARYGHPKNPPELKTIVVPEYGTFTTDEAFLGAIMSSGGLWVLAEAMPRELVVQSKGQIRKVKEDLGISGERTDGLVRLLGTRKGPVVTK